MMTIPRALDFVAGRVKVASAPEDNVSERSLGADSAFAVPAHKIKRQILSRRPGTRGLCARGIQFFVALFFAIERELKQNP